MGRQLVFVATVWRLERETLAGMLSALRPDVEVRLIEPGLLEAEVVRWRPDLVVYSDASEVVETRVRAWLLLYPSGEDRADASVDGRRRSVDHPNLATVLDLVDAAR